MAQSQGVSKSTVNNIWRAHNLQPHRTETFKLSRDPKFLEKMTDVVGLYLNPPQKAIVLCVDEKSQIQALDRTQPGLPMILKLRKVGANFAGFYSTDGGKTQHFIGLTTPQFDPAQPLLLGLGEDAAYYSPQQLAAMQFTDWYSVIGQPAHFSLVHGDPLSDARALWRVWSVFQAGDRVA